MHRIMDYILGAALLVLVLFIARQFEKRNPIEPEQDCRERIADYKLAALNWTTNHLLAPVIVLCSTTIIAALGGGFIPLRTDGWWFPVSFLTLILAIDLWGYAVHYASHKIPVLWTMHSLHHSAEALSMITGVRHFWFEQVYIAFLPILGIIFKAPPEMLQLIGLVYFLIGDGFVHLNMRISFGPFALVLNNPQYHRIHHSVESQHWDKNFCRMLPIFDIIFGTAWKPGKDEFPRTGLTPPARATGFIDGFIWPLRNKLSWPVLRAMRTP